MSLTTPVNTGTWAGYWNLVGDKITYQFLTKQARNPNTTQIAQLLKRNGNRDLAAALNVLIGAASGTNVTKTYKREQSPAGPSAAVPAVTGLADLGGLRPIEVVTVLNRNTTAADVTTLKQLINDALLEAGLTYPTVIGSGGGGKLANGTVNF